MHHFLSLTDRFYILHVKHTHKISLVYGNGEFSVFLFLSQRVSPLAPLSDSIYGTREAKKMSEGNFCAFFFFAISRCCLCGRVVEALHKKKQPTILFMVSFITRTCRVRCMHQSGNNLCWMKWKFPLIKFSPSSDSESERVTRCIS